MSVSPDPRLHTSLVTDFAHESFQPVCCVCENTTIFFESHATRLLRWKRAILAKTIISQQTFEEAIGECLANREPSDGHQERFCQTLENDLAVLEIQRLKPCLPDVQKSKGALHAPLILASSS